MNGKTQRDEKPPAPAAAKERIAKVLARRGVASRREAERMIAEGRIAIAGKAVTSPATLVSSDCVLSVDGRAVAQIEKRRLWLYHKPKGLITTHRDPQGRPTVFDSLPDDLPRVISVGRLDLNSEGLLLLTNDGELARRLESPELGWLRRYRVRAFGAPDESLLKSLARGVEVDGMRYGPIEAAIESRTGQNAWLSVGLREGKKREVRIVLDKIGLKVNRLIRVSFGPFQLGNLEEGALREVPPKVLAEQLGGKTRAETKAPRS